MCLNFTWYQKQRFFSHFLAVISVIARDSTPQKSHYNTRKLRELSYEHYLFYYHTGYRYVSEKITGNVI
ncbi:hypothetical protein SARI_00694 [Salmonella enterica subsp. arizonae serovar 62:z4,z23:-]|uniref:Uncharacterized protein n=1 Tax=Salmonella arizonae (strain ATCC BAA-731 / CDC346-86 / RSK2980) TaxID=41514 RepID=A9MK57_SALAR|nr:hypothetical protein SARI_00694 [Salmonella enterica subsp. arizonae serovar 62:z4,z23:-]